MSTMEEQEELIGEDLYGTLWAEGVTSDSFARLAERIAAVRAEGEERLQKYTAEYLKEGIKRCDAALKQGWREGAEQERERIRKTAQVWLTGDPPPNDTWYGVDKKELDPSVLAPTKEKP